MPSSVITATATTSVLVAHFTESPEVLGKGRLGEEEEEDLSDECKALLSTLPKERGWRTSYLYKFKDFGVNPKKSKQSFLFQKHFKAKDSDIILTSIPKSGTTWLKALTFAIVNRKRFPIVSNKNHPLLASNPHDLVPFFEYKLYTDKQVPQLSNFSEPRVFATHIPYALLNSQESIRNSNAKIVYFCRNPFDTLVSSWHFIFVLVCIQSMKATPSLIAITQSHRQGRRPTPLRVLYVGSFQYGGASPNTSPAQSNRKHINWKFCLGFGSAADSIFLPRVAASSSFSSS